MGIKNYNVESASGRSNLARNIEKQYCQRTDNQRDAISPEMWEDGQPADKAVLNDWEKISNPETVDMKNIIERAYTFLGCYEQEFGYDFSETKQWIWATADETIVEKAYDEAQLMYQKFQYAKLV